MAETWPELCRRFGSYEIEQSSDVLAFRWRRPAALAGGSIPFDLRFICEATQHPPMEPDTRMLALWDRYERRHVEFASWFGREVIAEYRNVFWTGRSYTQGYPVDLPDSNVLNLVESAVIEIGVRDDCGDVWYHLIASLQFAWDQSHTYESEFDEVSGRFLALEKR